MKIKTLLLVFTILISASLLTACGGAMPSSSWSGITADQDMIYLAHNTYVYGINLTNRQQVWRFPEKAQNTLTFHAAPVLTADNQLLVGSYGPAGYNLYSLNPANGMQNWIFAEAKNHYITSPLATDNAIYAPNSDGNMYILDLKGNLIETFKSTTPLWATPAINDTCDCLFLPSMDHSLYALETLTGKIIWNSDDLGGAMVSAPTFSEDGKLFIGTFASEMLALNADDGKVLWRYKTDGMVWSQPNLVDDVLYFGDAKGMLYAVNTDGTEKWKIKAAGPIVNMPLVQGENIYVTAGTNAVYAYGLDGANAWQQILEENGTFQGSVIRSEDSLLVSPLNSQTALYVLNSSGVQQWTFIPEK
jgi:outer membrane protein assembly factor BamB